MSGKKNHKLKIIRGEYSWECITPIHLGYREPFINRVKARWADVTCKKCLAKRA